MEGDYSVVILAGGKGKRMNSETLKPLILLKSKRMIEYVVETFKFAGIHDIIVVSHPLGFKQISQIPGVTKVVVQEEPLGTFHALKAGIDEVKTKYVFVTPADKPLLRSSDVHNVMKLDDQVIYGYESSSPKAVLVLEENASTAKNASEGYKNQRIMKIAEDPEDIKANIDQKYRTGGVYCFKTEFIKNLECDKHITRKNKNYEYYLTDIIPFLETKPLLYEIEKTSVANINTAQELEQISNLFFNPKKSSAYAITNARLNLMGRHIDHQGGFTNVILLPSLTMVARIRARADLYNRYLLKSKYGMLYYDSKISELPRDGLIYLVAPIKYLQDIGYISAPCSIEIEGTIPEGAGLSSSSAIIVAVMKALVEFNGISVSSPELVMWCGEAEKLVGTNGGYGDQAAMILGKIDIVTKMITNTAVKVYDTVRIPRDLGVIVINSGEVAKKAFESKTAYNSKVDCYKEGLRVCKEHYNVESLTDVTLQMIENLIKKSLIDSEVARVMEYGIREMTRAACFTDVLKTGDLAKIGLLVKESQDDERKLYGCSTAKIDVMVEQINRIEGVLGSQICGAGLGGSIMVFYDKKFEVLNQLIVKYDVTCLEVLSS